MIWRVFARRAARLRDELAEARRAVEVERVIARIWRDHAMYCSTQADAWQHVAKVNAKVADEWGRRAEAAEVLLRGVRVEG